jgi:ADP-ribose pyrophosphatase YjhB (NUDIX family)
VKPVPREAARALVLDPDDRVLLVRMVPPGTSETFWTTPGGGLDPGEALQEGLSRELREETGLDEVEPGPVIWTRREVFPWAGETLDQSEQIVLLRVPSFEPKPQLTPERLVAEGVYELRWWALAEIEGSSETFYPTRLAEFLRQLLEDGPPDEPIDVGV